MKNNLANSNPALIRFLVILILLGSGCLAVRSSTVIQLEGDYPCPEGRIVIKEEANTSVSLSIKKAVCSDFSSTIILQFKNIGIKPIRGYEISHIQDYENKSKVKGSQGIRGNEIKPGESVEVNVNGGVSDGNSYGKPVGLLKRETIKISWIEFSDGTLWGADKARFRQIEPPKWDLKLRDDKEPFTAFFRFDRNELSIGSDNEYAFGGHGLKIETTGCNKQLTFDFRWRGNDFSFHPRKKPNETMTIKTGDNLHGEFIYDSCTKIAKGTIRNDNQNLTLMVLSDTNTSDKIMP